jgi:acetate kinase
VHIDASANAGAELIISRTDSRVRVYVVPTDEESMIARQTLALLHSMR